MIQAMTVAMVMRQPGDTAFRQGVQVNAELSATAMMVTANTAPDFLR